MYNVVAMTIVRWVGKLIRKIQNQSTKQMILELKANLFDFHNLFIHKHNRINEVMKHSYQELMKGLQFDDAKFFIDSQELARLAPNQQHPLLKNYISTDRRYLSMLAAQFPNDESQVQMNHTGITLHDVHFPFYIVMKLCSSNNFNGYYMFVYSDEPDFDFEMIEEIQQVINKHFVAICNHFQERFTQERNELLFQLSANLHSIYSTTDVLKRVYRSLALLYPKYECRFLMSHEYEDPTIPVYTMEFLDNRNYLGAKAFMNNTLQVEMLDKEEKTIIYSPLAGRQGVYGVFEIKIPGLVDLNESDYDFIQQSSIMIGRAVERTTLYQSSTQLITDLQFINVATRDLNRNLEMAEISESVKKHIIDSCQAEEIGIVLLPNDESVSEKYVITEESTTYFKLSRANDPVKYLYKALQKNPEPILSGNFKIEDIPIPFNSVMVIPMWDSERMFGFIVIAHEKPYYFSFDKYKFVQSFVQHAALAYTNSLLKEKLRQTAITDYLTKLYTRNYLDEKIDAHMGEQNGGAFMLFDVDDFKLVNDTFGHYVGDKVLIQIADILRSTLNDKEIAARWGGEEFAVYLPYCDAIYAEKIARQIRLSIKENTEPTVTVSIGISTWCTNRHSIEELFIKADEALYEAKSTGKNRIIIN